MVPSQVSVIAWDPRLLNCPRLSILLLTLSRDECNPNLAILYCSLLKEQDSLDIYVRWVRLRGVEMVWLVKRGGS